MTIREVIGRVDNLKFNTFTNAEKIAWLANLEHKIALTVRGERGRDRGWYTQDPELLTSMMDTYLLVPPPFDALYLRYLEAQIDYHNGEISKYNNAIALYDAEYDAYADWYIRTHAPASSGDWVI